MRTWRGWATMVETPTAQALTWSEWRARSERIQPDAQPVMEPHPERPLLTERELARLSFVRWLYESGRIGPRDYDSV